MLADDLVEVFNDLLGLKLNHTDAVPASSAYGIPPVDGVGVVDADGVSLAIAGTADLPDPS